MLFQRRWSLAKIRQVVAAAVLFHDRRAFLVQVWREHSVAIVGCTLGHCSAIIARLRLLGSQWEKPNVFLLEVLASRA